MLLCRKKLNYAELCEGPSEEGEPECRLSQDWSGKGTGTGKDAEGRQVSPQERKRPKSAPSSVVHQLASPDADRQAKLKQALALQIEMQKRLHDQLEVWSLFRPAFPNLTHQVNTNEQIPLAVPNANVE